jgi:hypothetical protein
MFLRQRVETLGAKGFAEEKEKQPFCGPKPDSTRKCSIKSR